jgi:hypothetical protein
MATIIDPDSLRDAATDSAQNIFISTALRTIKVRNNNASANANKGPVLDNTGVTLQALYSFLKEEWKNDPNNKTLIAYPFPLIAITPEQFEFRYGWTPADDSSRSLLRTAGWREYAADNATLKRQYMGVISLGNIDGDQAGLDAGDQDKAYYGFFNSSTLDPIAGPFNFNYAGPVNEAVQTLDSTSVDYRTRTMTVFIRQPSKSYDQTNTTDIGITAGTALPYNVQRFPLAEGTDLNVVDRTGTALTDTIITDNSQAGEKYDSADGNGPKILFGSTARLSSTFSYTKDLSGGPYNFGIRIDGVSGDGSGNLSKTEIYSWVQYRLRSTSNIEDSAGASKVGKLTDELLEFVGSTLKTKNATNLDGGGTGVAILNFLATDVNDLAFRDNTEAERTFPFTAAGTVSFSNEILLDSSSAKFFMYHEYTRAYTGNIVIANAGTASSNALLDSANFTLSGFTTTPLNSVQNPLGMSAGRYFKLTGASNDNNNQIWKVLVVRDSTRFAAETYDDIPAANASLFAGSIRTRPINSPDAVLVDSAGTTVENSGGITSTLAVANLSSGTYTFEYDYDGNTQYDRVISTNVPIVIRALGLTNGSFVELTGVNVTRSTTNSYSVISAVERNYSNT